jgi:hypothetical protein
MGGGGLGGSAKTSPLGYPSIALLILKVRPVQPRESLRKSSSRLGTMDLRIGGID